LYGFLIMANVVQMEEVKGSFLWDDGDLRVGSGNGGRIDSDGSRSSGGRGDGNDFGGEIVALRNDIREVGRLMDRIRERYESLVVRFVVSDGGVRTGCKRCGSVFDGDSGVGQDSPSRLKKRRILRVEDSDESGG
jgi:hypothetical protein